MTCDTLSELLPLYAAGTLPAAQRGAVEEHLAGCPACREDLALWRAVRSAVAVGNVALPPPPSALPERVLSRARWRRVGAPARAWALVVAQVHLVRQEIWLASAFIMALGYLVAVIAGRSGAAIVEALAPLVAAAGVAMIYGPENDPGLELALATPASPRQVLLARLALVYGYDLALALVATLGLVPFRSPGPLGALILSWLAPMSFLSALALVLSLCIGTDGAITAAMGLWLARGLGAGMPRMHPAGLVEAAVVRAAAAYAQAWRSSMLLFALAAALLGVAMWAAGQRERLLAGRL